MSKICLDTYDGETKPYSSAQVYFSCHPKDFRATFDVLSADIYTAYQFAGIYYEGEWEIPANPEELKAVLSEVRLLVIPITKRYLTEESRSISFELQFAMETHIPVIPIIVEPNLGELYVKRMRELGENYEYMQFLDRTLIDSTTTPYAKKMKDYFSQLFNVGRELKDAKDIFRKTLFLSYRKVNRSEANELMKRIHSIPGLWDIAIWYDDFLVPGERWNDAIIEAMNDSDAMLLSVTPSILEPNNYVIDKEYPTFVNAGKKIIPVEMLPTDGVELQATFLDMPSVVDGNDEMALEKACAFLINDEKVMPERMYFAGIAYQVGIYVERDSQRAVRLFTAAYEEGYYRAAGKIALMYEIGDGVPINQEESALWYEKYVLGMERDESNEKILAGLMAICFMRVAYKFKQAKQNEKARYYYQYVNELIWNMEFQDHSNANWSNLRDNYISLAKISNEAGEYEAEKCDLDRARRFPHVDKDDIDSRKVNSLRLRIMLQFGLDCLQEKQWEKAICFFSSGLEIVNNNTDKEALSTQIVVDFFAGFLQLIKTGDVREAVELGEACRETLKKLIHSGNYEAFHRKLIEFDEYLGRAFMDEGRDETGAAYYREGAQSARLIAEFTHKVRDYDKYGSLLLKLSIWADAEELETAVHLYTDLAEKYPANGWFEIAKRHAEMLLDDCF